MGSGFGCRPKPEPAAALSIADQKVHFAAHANDAMTFPALYFVHISDTHFGPVPGFANHGALALPAAQRLVDHINQMPVAPDFVIHTGDITNNPSPEAYQLASAVLSGIRLPVYYVRGNHDSAVDISHHMNMGPAEDLSEDRHHLTYAFTCKGRRFLVLDSHAPPEDDPQGFLSANQLALLHNEAAADGPPLTVFLHHPLLPMDSPWMDANMLVSNGLEVHNALLLARGRLRGVFFGHIHQSLQMFKDGILYVSAASSLNQMTSWPSDLIVQHQHDEPPGYNFVRLTSGQTTIRQHRFSVA
jgi:3',5'-cyclic-AMP phosphodiesterase